MEGYYTIESISCMMACGDNCPYCRNEHLNFSKAVWRETLVDYLDASVFIDGPESLSSLSKKLYQKRGSIWVAPAKHIVSGQVHSLILQLWAAGIFEFRLHTPPLPTDVSK